MWLDELTCSRHGWLSHFGVHEAGHVVAALSLGFEFLSVSIVPADQVYQQVVLGQAAIGAGVLMPSDDPTEWVGPRPADALVYLLAGSLAEKEILGDWLDGGYQGDLTMWRRGTGRLEAQMDEVQPLLHAALVRGSSLISDNREAIVRVYGLMIERVPKDGTQHLGFDEPLVFSYDEVRAAVGATH